MKITADFVTSAASASGFPRERLPEVALVGRSNVGKSSLINALVRQRVARTSAAPGKTRLANIYRVAWGSSASLYLVDLPGYGYARGGGASAREFAELARAYFGVSDKAAASRGRESTLEAEAQRSRHQARGWGPAPLSKAALLLVDSRHPGLDSDIEAWAWLKSVVPDAAIVATKIDKLARGQRIRALRELESAFEDSVLPVSAVTGEGLDELWKLIDRLANSRKPQRLSKNSRGSSPRQPPGVATAPTGAPRKK